MDALRLNIITLVLLAALKNCLFCIITFSVEGVLELLTEVTSKIPTYMTPSEDIVTSISRRAEDTVFTMMDLIDGAFGSISTLPEEDPAGLGRRVEESIIGLGVVANET